MIKKYKVVTLCGSTKFKDEFHKAQDKLTLKGIIVISVGLFGHSDKLYGNELTDEVKIMLDDMHKRKIDMADEIFVINKDGYIGDSTKSEIEYAQSISKKINYMFKGCEDDCCFTTAKGCHKKGNEGVCQMDMNGGRFPMCEFYICEDK